ncbi:MAG: hypothetical protein DIU79_00075 [Actinobacteria bacterium]|nr:MAG: hypothetical protein DIU79_00075 [Actinomycetota bacterium]
MPRIDLTHLASPTLDPFIVELPDGELTLRPIVALPTEGQTAMLRLSGKLATLDTDGDLSAMATALADALDDIDTLLKAACPSKTAANKLMKVLGGNLMAKIQVAVAYIAQDQSGEASPSASS